MSLLLLDAGEGETLGLSEKKVLRFISFSFFVDEGFFLGGIFNYLLPETILTTKRNTGGCTQNNEKALDF